MMLFGVAAHANPVISNVYPNGTNMFQPSTTLSFTVTSGTGVTNVTVDLTIKDLYTGQLYLSHLTSASGLTISGSSVSAPLQSNKLYTSVAIVAYDAAGSTTTTETFDTINPVYTWEAEDFDYTNGLYFDTGVNQYANLSGVQGVDYNNGNPANGTAAYRPKGLETENPNSADLPLRLQYIGTTNFDYDVGWTARGDWGNYTRQYPAGTYNLFVRDAGGGNASAEAGDIKIVSGTATSTNVGPYKFAVLGLGWGTYSFVPVTDVGGNLVQITFDGSACTLQETQVDNADNMNFFMLMPVPTVLPSTITITNISPDGTQLYNQNATFSFTCASPSAPVNAGNIAVLVTATNLYGHGSTTSLNSGNGLTITGQSTNLTASFPLAINTLYSLLITVTDVNGTPSSSTVAFDTITAPPITPTASSTYTFEAEDFDYNSGLFYDNPQTNAYYDLDGVSGVDFYLPSAAQQTVYRNVGLNTEQCFDDVRPAYNGTTNQFGVSYLDYDVGNTAGGQWGNYTRNYPAGTYNIYVRASDGGGSSTDSGSIALIGAGGSVTKLGTFSVAATGNWQKYSWVPVLDALGNLARFNGGSQETLRATTDNGNYNANFYLLTPADPSLKPLPTVSGFEPDGSALFQYTNKLSFVANSSAGLATGNITLNLNGVNVSGLTISGSSFAWNVTYPVAPNTSYTAIITLTDANGTIHSTNVFGTYNSTNYQWEAEDYDYTNGQYVDNPQVGAYAGFGATTMVDIFESDLAGPTRGNSYRPANGVDFPDAVANDMPRAQFTAAGKTDYNLGSFGIGSWANYTRHYPSGTYTVLGRFGEGAGIAGANLALLTNGVSTNLLGTFTIPNEGWGTWQWQQMLDTKGNPAKVTLDGNAQILRLGGTTANEVNVNFLMLVPVTPTPTITVTASGGVAHVSFLTQTGYSYQLQYATSLPVATWTSVGSSLSGNGAVQTVNDTPAGSERFYRVQVQVQ
jgi:hypothetical protein